MLLPVMPNPSFKRSPIGVALNSHVRQRKHHFRSSYPEMQAFTWSPTEKQLARAVFEVAAAAEEQEVLARFKTRAAALKNLEDLVGPAKSLQPA